MRFQMCIWSQSINEFVI
ncbi:hypothetical protein Gotri_026180, partial [Gossypium trilobum]|nr:hypothetical protein [Gossypium trilobum]